MAKYAVGDVQGCLDPLKALLSKVDFNPSSDILISVGDLVNRGPQSLATLRYCMGLGNAFKMVLGNHDLHLLAIAEGVRVPSAQDTIQEVLDAPDREKIFSWLRNQPLLLTESDYYIVHAGIPHIWGIDQAQSLANEVSDMVQSAGRKNYFKYMYGNQPDEWHNSLEGNERLRVITNYLTRMRFCDSQGKLDLKAKDCTSQPEPFRPWFSFERIDKRPINIIFGHWAALQGKPFKAPLFALDTGYVWGGSMRLMALKEQQIYHQDFID
jgi:bis(5'-nucleosyl)-tetraphosphatase (symmetrical)